MEFSRYVARAFLMLFTNLFLYTFVLEIYFKKKKKGLRQLLRLKDLAELCDL